MRQSLKSWGLPDSKLLISKDKNKIKVLENSFCIWPKDANPFFSEILIFFLDTAIERNYQVNHFIKNIEQYNEY